MGRILASFAMDGAFMALIWVIAYVLDKMVLPIFEFQGFWLWVAKSMMYAFDALMLFGVSLFVVIDVRAAWLEFKTQWWALEQMEAENGDEKRSA